MNPDRVDQRSQPNLQMPTGIPQWLYQFLNSQGGMQGLLYQAGGIQGLLAMIQEQSQQAQQPNLNPRGIRYGQDPANLSTSDRAIADPFGWWDYRQASEAARPDKPLSSSAQRPGVLSDADYAAWKQPGGNFNNMQGLARYSGLPDSLKSTATPDQLKTLQDAENQARLGFMGNQTDPALQKAYSQAHDDLMSARWGPLYKQLQTTNLDMANVIKPQSDFAQRPNPLSKWDYAAQYGYGTTGHFGSNAQRQRAIPSPGGWQNAQQTLRAAGWDPSKGYGPQTDWGTLSNGQPRNEKQQKMLNDLLYSISPTHQRTNTRENRLAAAAAARAVLPEPPDPFVGMQSAINRDAYVNETLGGGFYGGLIPDEDAINTFGERTIGGAHDPHFATPQLRLNPLPGDSEYDTYAGWASDQGAAFGTAPWANDSQWGQAMGYNDPKLYKQPPPPGTAFQPTPQYGQGGVNTFGGSLGWGNTSRNGQNNAFGGTSSTQQQPMTFGTSPWDNPWGMR